MIKPEKSTKIRENSQNSPKTLNFRQVPKNPKNLPASFGSPGRQASGGIFQKFFSGGQG